MVCVAAAREHEVSAMTDLVQTHGALLPAVRARASGHVVGMLGQQLFELSLQLVVASVSFAIFFSSRGVSISLGRSRRSGDPPVVYLTSADLGGSQTFFAPPSTVRERGPLAEALLHQR